MMGIIGGIIAMVIGVLWVAVWGGWDELLIVIQGTLPTLLIIGGLIAITAGLSTIKERAAMEKEVDEEA